MSTSDVVFELTEQYEELAELAEIVTERAWDELEEVMADLVEADPSGATSAAWALLDFHGVDALVDAHLGTSRLARTLRCHRGVVEAWEIRTHLRASEVSAEQFEAFGARLAQVETELIDLAAQDPSDPLVATLRLTTARGLGLGASEGERRYRRVAAISPDNASAQSSYLQFVAPKWYGSTEQMFAFAREAVASAPLGSHAGILIAEAQLEQWLELGEGGGAYLADEAQRAELVEAEEVSVFHSDYEEGLHWVSDHSTFALVHSLAGRYAAAATHFEVLGDLGSTGGWDYLGDGRRAFAEHRARALAAVS